MCSLIQAAAAVDTAVCCHSLTCMTTSLLSSTLYSSPQMRFDWPFSNMASLACVVFVCGDEHDACAFGVCGGGGRGGVRERSKGESGCSRRGLWGAYMQNRGRGRLGTRGSNTAEQSQPGWK